MRISHEHLISEAESSGFRSEILEKVFHLLNLLNLFTEDPFLGSRLVLSGGTALNLFVFDIPRLSVDIDMNYIGRTDLEGMKEERPLVEKTISNIISREGFNIRFMPEHHAGGKWHLQYETAQGQRGNLQVDVNFLLRVPLWPVQRIRPKYAAGEISPIPVLDIHELAAGKLAALFSRTTCRDVFDSFHLLKSGNLSIDKLKIGLLVYGGFNRENWLDISPDTLQIPEASDFLNEIQPMVRSKYFSDVENKSKWANELFDELREMSKPLFDYSNDEREFLTSLIMRGEIKASLLTQDQDMINRIESHPALQWKAMNVRQFKRGKE